MVLKTKIGIAQSERVGTRAKCEMTSLVLTPTLAKGQINIVSLTRSRLTHSEGLGMFRPGSTFSMKSASSGQESP